MSESSATLTLKGAILDAIVQTADKTGLRAGPASDALQQALFETLTGPQYRWSLKAVHDEAEPVAEG